MEKKSKIITGVFVLLVIAITVGCVVLLPKKSEKSEKITTSQLEEETDDSYIQWGMYEEEFEDYPDVTATFHITIPEPIPEGYYITMGCNINDWYPLSQDWVIKKVDDTHYTCTLNLKHSYFWYNTEVEDLMKNGELNIGLQYKWTLQHSELDYENMWSMVEISKANHDIQNRIVILKEGENEFYDEVGRFKGEDEVLNNEPTIVGKMMFETIQAEGLLSEKSRLIRVWVPEGYDATDTSKRYPVYYMHDAQNLYDNSTSFAGEWMVDESITELVKQGYEGCIVVGIDSIDEYRMSELSPTFTSESGVGEDYAKFIVEKVKPYIDGKYNTKPEREYTGIGGSSMGGAMSYFMALEYPEIFGKAICFSTALVYYTDDMLIEYMESKNFGSAEHLPKLCIYSGGIGINSGIGNDEKSLLRYVEFLETNLIAKGYPEENIYAFTDEMADHSEAAWSKYFPAAFKWLEEIE